MHFALMTMPVPSDGCQVRCKTLGGQWLRNRCWTGVFVPHCGGAGQAAGLATAVDYFLLTKLLDSESISQ